jgi:hypothetical protein
MRRKSDYRNAVEVVGTVKDGFDALVRPRPGAVGRLSPTRIMRGLHMALIYIPLEVSPE